MFRLNTNSVFIYSLSVFFLLSACQNKKETAVRPNILFIMSDDHTAQAWGIYGGILADYVQHANIDRLAKKGAVLNNAFCTNSICVPSRASILSGQYSHRNGVFDLAGAYSPDSSNVAKILQKNGYETAIIGKWHLKKEPSGFDHYMVLPSQGLYQNPIFKTKDNWQDEHGGGRKYQGFSTDLITDYSIQWMQERNREKPFFLMCHYKATHEPFDYPARFAHLYENDTIPYPLSFYDQGRETTGRTFKGQVLENLGQNYITASNGSWWCEYPGLPFQWDGLDGLQKREKTYQKFIKDFMRCGAAIDDNIGKILDFLEASDLAENTIVIYTSDQGYFLGEHGFYDKRMIYEESLRMPFVVCYPKEIKGGQRFDDIVLNIDFPSLFLDYAGVSQPQQMQGQSFRQILQGQTPEKWRKSMYYRYWHNEPHRPAHFGIRNHRYKLALFYGQSRQSQQRDTMPDEPGWEFYDLQKDPTEQHNAYADPQYYDIIQSMKKEMQSLQAYYGESNNPFLDQHIRAYY